MQCSGHCLKGVIYNLYIIYPQSAGIVVEEGAEGLEEPEVVEECYERYFYSHGRLGAHVSSQRLWVLTPA